MYNNQAIPLSSLQQDSCANLVSTYPRAEYARIGVQGYSSFPVVDVDVTHGADCVGTSPKSNSQRLLEWVFPLLLPDAERPEQFRVYSEAVE